MKLMKHQNLTHEDSGYRVKTNLNLITVLFFTQINTSSINRHSQETLILNYHHQIHQIHEIIKILRFLPFFTNLVAILTLNPHPPPDLKAYEKAKEVAEAKEAAAAAAEAHQVTVILDQLTSLNLEQI